MQNHVAAWYQSPQKTTSYTLLDYLTGPFLLFQTSVQKERDAMKYPTDNTIFMFLPWFYEWRHVIFRTRLSCNWNDWGALGTVHLVSFFFRQRNFLGPSVLPQWGKRRLSSHLQLGWLQSIVTNARDKLIFPLSKFLYLTVGNGGHYVWSHSGCQCDISGYIGSLITFDVKIKHTVHIIQCWPEFKNII